MTSHASLRGRSALITGASRGIGRAIAQRFADEGAQLHLVARGVDESDELAAGTGGRGWPTDLTDDAAVWDTVDRLQDALAGPPDLVVNSAGVFDLAPLVETSVEAFDRNLRVNLRGTFLVVRAVLPGMLERGHGDIVNLGSIACRKAFPGNAAYAASKFGLRGLHEVLLEELRGTGVRATLLEPAATDTSLWDPHDPDENRDLPDRSKMLRPEDVAEAALFVATRPEHVHIPFLPVEPG